MSHDSEMRGETGEGSRVRWLAASVAILAGMCHLTTETTLFPAVVGVFLIPPWIGRKPKDLGPPASAALLVTVFFSLKLYFAPFEPSGVRTLLAFPLAHACGQGLMCWQVAALWTRRDRWLQYVPLCGTLAAMCWGDVELDAGNRWLFTAGLLSVLTCHALAMGASLRRGQTSSSRATRGRRLAVAGVLCLFGTATLAASPLVGKFWRRFEEFLNAHLADRGRVSEIGFTTQSHLGSVTISRSFRSEQVVLRVESPDEPGYLRGAAYDTFEAGSWQNNSRWTMLTATSPGLSNTRVWEPAANEGLFVLSKMPPDQERFDTLVWPEAATADRLMLPPGADALIAAHDRVQKDASGIVAVVPGNDATLPYRAHRSRAIGSPPTRETHPEWFEVHRYYAERMRMLADDFCWTGESPAEAAERIKTFLRNNFRYSLNVGVPVRTDPLVHFLNAGREGQCEYFATATTLLLRMQGIPARYVTGYLCDEFNPRGGNWIARRKDAHAWAEAWLPGEGWVVIDSTPPSGRSQPSTTRWWIGEWDAMQWLLRKARWEAARDGWAGAMYWVRAFFQTVPGLVVSLAFLAWLTTRVAWPIVRSLWLAGSTSRDHLATRLEQLEIALARVGCVREPSETLEHFANRLRGATPNGPDFSHSPEAEGRGGAAVAEWLRRYSAARYGGDELEARRLLSEPLPAMRSPG